MALRRNHTRSRAVYKDTTSAWFRAKPAFVYGGNDSEIISITENTLPTRRDVRYSRYRICAAILNLFYE